MKKLLNILLLSMLIVGCKTMKVPYGGLTNQNAEKIGHPFETFTFYEDSVIVSYQTKNFTGIAFGFTDNGYMNDGTRICEDDSCSYEIMFKNGKLDGLWKMWSKEGKIVYEANRKNGKLDGLSKGWFADGRLEWEANWKNGIKENGYLYNKDGSISEF